MEAEVVVKVGERFFIAGKGASLRFAQALEVFLPFLFPTHSEIANAEPQVSGGVGLRSLFAIAR